MTLKPSTMSDANWRLMRMTCDVCDVLSGALDEPKKSGLSKNSTRIEAWTLWSEMTVLNNLLSKQAISLDLAEDYINVSIAGAWAWIYDVGICARTTAAPSYFLTEEN